MSTYVHDDPATYAAWDDETAFATGDETNEPRERVKVDRTWSDEQDDKLRPKPRHGNGSGRAVPRVPTERQVAYFRKLCAERGVDADERVRFLQAKGQWTSGGMSKAIDTLLLQRPTQPTAKAARTNRHPGPCADCGVEVAAEAGRLEAVETKGVRRSREGLREVTETTWLVRHPEGQCPERTQPAPPLADVPAGHYAVESTGHNDLAFYRVDRPSDGAYAGHVFVKLVVGGHPDRNVKRDHVPGILARIAEAGVEVAAQLYGQEVGRCSRCNRHLTDKVSRARGIGPECVKRGA